MAKFNPPTFNLMCGITTAGAQTPPYRITPMCNLQYGRHVPSGLILVPGPIIPYVLVTVMFLLLPKLTDVRDDFTAGGTDGVEVPIGSGRWYTVMHVDDCAKGFANEYRIAIISKMNTLWPTPIP